MSMSYNQGNRRRRLMVFAGGNLLHPDQKSWDLVEQATDYAYKLAKLDRHRELAKLRRDIKIKLDSNPVRMTKNLIKAARSCARLLTINWIASPNGAAPRLKDIMRYIDAHRPSSALGETAQEVVYAQN